MNKKELDRIKNFHGHLGPYVILGYKMGESLVEDDAMEIARDILKQSEGKLSLPDDVVIADKFSETAK